MVKLYHKSDSWKSRILNYSLQLFIFQEVSLPQTFSSYSKDMARSEKIQLLRSHSKEHSLFPFPASSIIKEADDTIKKASVFFENVCESFLMVPIFYFKLQVVSNF